MTEGQDTCECGHTRAEHEDARESEMEWVEPVSRQGDVEAGTHRGTTRCRVCTDCVKFRPRRADGR
jgi:hypothetical protein